MVQIAPPQGWTGGTVTVASAAVLAVADAPEPNFTHVEPPSDALADMFEAAAAAYDQARLYGLPPRMLWYQFGPYEAYLEAGRPSDVLALAEATLATQGGRSLEETYYYQGRALMMAGNAPAARAALARAVELNPDSPMGLAARDLLQDG